MDCLCFVPKYLYDDLRGVGMTAGVAPHSGQNVPSPFCGIASDDLVIQIDGRQVRVVGNGDAVTRAGFEWPPGDGGPMIKGVPATLEDAVAHAAGLLRNARLPVFSGFGTDVNDTRAAISLIDRTRGVFDQARSEAGLRNMLVLADSGWIATTLAEVKNRVEVLVVFGSDIESAFPRFFERFVWPRETMFGRDVEACEVYFIGRAPSGRAAFSPGGRAPVVWECDPDALPEVAATMAALARGARPDVAEVGGIAMAGLSTLVERMQQANYSVVSWAAGHIGIPHAELVIQMLSRMVVTLNQTTRAAVLPLGGQDGDRTAGQVSSWLTGYPTRVSFARGYPEYDPYHLSTARLLSSGEADVLVWVSSLSPAAPPVSHAIPSIVIGRSGMQLEQTPDVFIPVGTPGIDHAGHMYRCDNVVALPLYKLRDIGLPSAAEVLKAVEMAL